MSFDQQTIIEQIIKSQKKKIDSQIRNKDNKKKKIQKERLRFNMRLIRKLNIKYINIQK